METKMIHAAIAAICVALASSPSLADVPTDGGEWTIGAGETETLAVR